jgi:hypothetical protein
MHVLHVTLLLNRPRPWRPGALDRRFVPGPGCAACAVTVLTTDEGMPRAEHPPFNRPLTRDA